MPKKNPNSGTEPNHISARNQIRFWERGEIAYSALQKINELKAINEMEKAKIILAEWYF